MLRSVRIRVPAMHDVLNGKKILVVEGSLIATEDLQEMLLQAGAAPFVAHNVSAAFHLVERIKFDGVILDHGLHNEAFDLCTELQAADIPYVSCRAPHRLQGWTTRKREAEYAVWKLGHVLSRAHAMETEMPVADYGARPGLRGGDEGAYQRIRWQ
jgi:CheY-like chemotaxis protein